MISKTAKVLAWGSAQGARRVTHLTSEEKNLIKAGGRVFIENCPSFRGETLRRVIYIKGRFYARMP